MTKKEVLILGLCLLLGFVLRFYTFDKKSLWGDEIYTFQDSRDDLKGQLKFYKENPHSLQAPLFFILTHQFYPFPKPERDLRIIPLIFGTLSIPMIYFLARSFSPQVALPSTLSLVFMTYHISLSQDGRSYSLLMFLGMAGLYFFLKHLKTLKKIYLLLVALFFSILFYTSYSSILFIALSQILWFYNPNEKTQKPTFSSFLTLNGLILLLCLPWIIFIGVSYKGQHLMKDPFVVPPSSFWYILYGLLQDWISLAPLLILSVILLILFPIFSKYKKNALILLAVFVIPIGGLYLFCKLLNIAHFVSSRYFINFFPIFLITIYLSLNALEVKFEKLKRFMRLRFLFAILFIASNLVILPLYYHSEKQDLRGLATYLKGQLRDGDKIFDFETMATLGILHYFGVSPKARYFILDFSKVTEKEFEYRTSFIYRNRKFTIYHSNSSFTQSFAQCTADGSRLWVVSSKLGAKEIQNHSASVLKGFFDGSFCNIGRFPTDASMYLFLLDPKSTGEKGMDMPIE